MNVSGTLIRLCFLSLFLCLVSCTSLQRDHYQRAKRYRAALAHIKFPTTRAHLYSELPPASKVTSGLISIAGLLLPTSESYRLDADFGIRMSVQYAHCPTFRLWSRGNRRGPMTSAMVDDLFKNVEIHRSPKDSILEATLTK